MHAQHIRLSYQHPANHHMVLCAGISYQAVHVGDKQGIWNDAVAFETAQMCEHLVRKFVFERCQDKMPHVYSAATGFRVQVQCCANEPAYLLVGLRLHTHCLFG